MMHYQIYKALADQHTQEVVAAARRRERIGAVSHDSTDTTPTPHLKDLGAALVGLLHLRRGASTRTAPASSPGAGSAMTSRSGAGPMGCSA